MTVKSVQQTLPNVVGVVIAWFNDNDELEWRLEAIFVNHKHILLPPLDIF